MSSRADLELRLASAFEAARVRWPTLAVDAAAFEAHASARYPEGVSPERWHAEELYLTCALLGGDTRALACFDAEYLAVLDRVLARFADPVLVDDARQVLRARLLVRGDDGSPPRIAAYNGKGPLAKWIEVAATRTAISLRRTARDIPVDDRTIVALQGAGSDPQLAHLKHTYRAQFTDAWRRALRELDADDRTLLRLHLIDRLPVDRIGALYGIHQTTAARRVRQVKERLGTRVHETLAATLDVAVDELASIVALIRSELDVTLGELLSTDADLQDHAPNAR
ncbi:MAG: sigma-70 family RNA polymerase sigma factor [Deltaproteobacteria bacterium]|nr:sigma-70 family RNA polymerase sigma factor [Deltaproteobacteria bacterium]